MYRRSQWVQKHYSLSNNNIPLFHTNKIISNISNYSYECNSSANKSRVIAFHFSSKWKIHFEASKQTNKLMVIDFSATWCGPCRAMEPFLDDLAAKYINVEFIKIDVDELPSATEEYKVQTLPAFILLKKGIQVDKVVRVKKDELQQKVEIHRL